MKNDAPDQPAELLLLGGIGTGLRWLEELVALVSGPMLTAGLAIALVDLFTDGKLLTSQPTLLYAWAISQALGVDGQLVGAAVKSGRAMRARRWGLALAYFPLIAGLSYVAYLAANVFATQQALGLTTQQALARLGMDGTSWITWRTAIAVALVIISGFLRYDPAKKAQESAEEIADRHHREEQDAAHKAKMRALTAGGLGAALHAATKSARGEAITPETEGTMTQESPAAGFGEPGSPSQALRVKRAALTAVNGVPNGVWIWSHLQQYARAKWGVELTDDAAKEHVKSVPSASRLAGVTGQPYGAQKRDVQRWADGRFAGKAATQAAQEDAG